MAFASDESDRIRTASPTAASPTAGYVTLAAVLLGALIGPMLMSGTTVALSTMGAELDASGGALQWVVTGYFLAAACSMLVAGSMADRLGRRRVLRIGAAMYVAGTAAVAAAPNIWVVDAARTVSGVGAAAVMVAGGALLAATFDGAARTRAFAAAGTTSGVGLALGPTVAGLMVDGFGWRATFLAFAAAGVSILAGTAWAIESRSETPARFDLRGLLTLTGGLGLIILAVTRLTDESSSGAAVSAQLVVGAGLLAAFVRTESRTADPLLDPSMLRNRRFAGWCLACVTLPLGSTAVLVSLPTYLQGTGGLSAGRAGAVMLMLTVPIVVFPSLGARALNRGVPPVVLITVALTAMAAGNAWLVVLHPGIPAVALLGPLVTIGAGSGLAIGIVDAQAMALVPADRVGMAAGLINTLRGGSNAVFVALFGAAVTAILLARTGDSAVAQRVSSGDLHSSDFTFLAESFTDAWRVVLVVVAAACGAAAATVAVLLRSDPVTTSQENRS